MSIGEANDFRTRGFGHVERYPPQDHFGGTGSAMTFKATTPFGSTNMQSAVSPLSLPALGNLNFSLPGITLPSVIPPIVIPAGGGGTAAPTTITVVDVPGGGTSYPGIDTLAFDGSVSVSNTPGSTTATVFVTGGGGGGTTSLIYGKITNAVKGTNAIWTYTVQSYGGVNYTAYNLLEKENTATLAYGYSVTGAGGDRISGTSYYIYPVPNNAWVAMEYTTGVTGSPSYWFSAPNRIAGSC